jgi:hypothetical protein
LLAQLHNFYVNHGFNVTVITSKHSAKNFFFLGARIILRVMALVQWLGDLYSGTCKKFSPDKLHSLLPFRRITY